MQPSGIYAEAVIEPNISYDMLIIKLEELAGIARMAVLATTVVALLVAVLFSDATTLWVLTAVLIGFLFGFFPERSDLCGTSFSERLS